MSYKNKYSKFFLIALTVIGFTACEKEVTIALQEDDPFLVVDAWVNNLPETQTITLAYSHPYFDEQVAPAISDATVALINETKEDTLWFVNETNEGVYTWSPNDEILSIGDIEDVFTLEIDFGGNLYTSTTVLNAVPSIDSITFEYYKKDLFIDSDYYVGDFWSKDLVGEGDTYWIKTWKNGIFLNKPSEINIAYDAAFSAGASFDSSQFITPVRQLMNPYDDDENDDLIPPYSVGDTAYVEIHSISNDAWFFLSRVIDETNTPTGFGALFATPLSNVPTNIQVENAEVAGCFNVAAISTFEAQVNTQTIRDKIED